jgi:hypothetical protein
VLLKLPKSRSLRFSVVYCLLAMICGGWKVVTYEPQDLAPFVYALYRPPLWEQFAGEGFKAIIALGIPTYLVIIAWRDGSPGHRQAAFAASGIAILGGVIWSAIVWLG